MPLFECEEEGINLCNEEETETDSDEDNGKAKKVKKKGTINAMTGERRFGISHDDDDDNDNLRKRWYYSSASFGLFFGLVLLLRRIMGSHTLQTLDSDISISSRWGVTSGAEVYLFHSYVDGLSLICKYTSTFL